MPSDICIREDFPSYDRLPPDIKCDVAARVAVEDPINLSAVSRDWYQTAEPMWPRHYGPLPCHRPTPTPGQWRHAVAEKLAYEKRLWTPLHGVLKEPDGEQAVARAKFLLQGAPKAAYFALHKATSEVFSEPEVFKMAIEALHATGRPLPAGEVAMRALRQNPSWAPYVMAHGAALGLAPVSEAAARVAPADTDPASAAERNEWGERPSFMGVRNPIDWATIAGRALILGHDSCVGHLLEAPFSQAQSRRPRADLGKLETAKAVSDRIAFMQRLGIDPLACLPETLTGGSPFAWQAMRTLLEATMPADEIPAYLGPVAHKIWLRNSDGCLPAVRLAVALGGRFAATPEQIEPLQNQDISSLNDTPGRVAAAVGAGTNPDLLVRGVPIAQWVLQKLERQIQSGWGGASEAWILADLHRSGVQVPAMLTRRVAQACLMYVRGDIRRLDTQTLDGLLTSGAVDANRRLDHGTTLLIEAAAQGDLGRLHMLVRHGACVSDYNAQFATALDLCKDSACAEYLTAVLSEGHPP